MPRVALLSELEAVAPEEAEADIIDGLVVAVDMLARRTDKKKYNKQLFLITPARAKSGAAT